MAKHVFLLRDETAAGLAAMLEDVSLASHCPSARRAVPPGEPMSNANKTWATRQHASLGS